MSLHYEMPVIHNISDVLPCIEGKPEFLVVKKDYGVTIVNYAFQGADTFPPVIDRPTAILRECRGLVFDSETGDLVSRRLHKFHNFLERPDTSYIDVSRPHQVLEKLDGSMLSPLRLDGGIRWITKMGLTQTSMQAETFVAKNPRYDAFAEHCISYNMTPIFEWCSPDNRIVVDYSEDALTLLAVRNNTSGTYWEYTSMVGIATAWNIPVVKAVCPPLASPEAFKEFEATVRAWEGMEGVVITWDDGSRCKIKADTYVALHRAKAATEKERDVVGIVLDNKVDDLLPLLSDVGKTKLMAFEDAVWQDVWVFVAEVSDTRKQYDKHTRKDFAQIEGINPAIRAAVFAIWDVWEGGTGPAIQDWAVAFIRKNLGNQAAFESKARAILTTAKWSR